MPMPPYPLSCYHPGCTRPAVYKIAARWSDGVTHELKTYALSCEECLADWARRSHAKQAACRLAAGETLEPPGIYELARGRRDQQLTRRPDLEAALGEAPRE
ncbi:MAG TPA: hypothetical protein VMS17_19380 [Gemmataceae bacterium]|nr:hypothetical protein [Gemmataceae bacterium]